MGSSSVCVGARGACLGNKSMCQPLAGNLTQKAFLPSFPVLFAFQYTDSLIPLLHSCTMLPWRRIRFQQQLGPVLPEMKAADRVTSRGKMAVQAKTPLVPHACAKQTKHAASRLCLGSATLRTNCHEHVRARHAQQASSEGSWSAVASVVCSNMH